MQKCYKFIPSDEEKKILLSSYSNGNDLYEETNQQSKILLQKYIVGNEIDASKLEDDWFPSIKAKVFISHSHKDEKLAICFANYLEEILGIDSFVDSCVWKNVYDLLEELDNRYSRKDEHSYYYDKAKEAAQHAFMILNVALQKQMDKCDYVIFINTSNSCEKKESGGIVITHSPWIYSEISFANILLRKNKRIENKGIKESFIYRIGLKNLEVITLENVDELLSKSCCVKNKKDETKKLVLNENM